MLPTVESIDLYMVESQAIQSLTSASNVCPVCLLAFNIRLPMSVFRLLLGSNLRPISALFFNSVGPHFPEPF